MELSRGKLTSAESTFNPHTAAIITVSLVPPRLPLSSASCVLTVCAKVSCFYRAFSTTCCRINTFRALFRREYEAIKAAGVGPGGSNRTIKNERKIKRKLNEGKVVLLNVGAFKEGGNLGVIKATDEEAKEDDQNS